MYVETVLKIDVDINTFHEFADFTLLELVLILLYSILPVTRYVFNEDLSPRVPKLCPSIHSPKRKEVHMIATVGLPYPPSHWLRTWVFSHSVYMKELLKMLRSSGSLSSNQNGIPARKLEG